MKPTTNAGARYRNVSIDPKAHARLLKLKAQTGLPIIRLLSRIISQYRHT